MIDPTIVILFVAFIVSFAIVVVRERGRVQIVHVADSSEIAAPRAQAAPAAAVPADTEWIARELDRVREEQVQLRIEIDRLKRPTGAPADG